VPGQWFSPGTTVSSTNNTDRHDIAEILSKVALNAITQTHVGVLTVVSNTNPCQMNLHLRFDKRWVNATGEQVSVCHLC